MLQTAPLFLDDFSGGITDNFIDCPLNKCQFAENFLITENKKLTTIPGSAIYDADKPQIPLGNQRVGALLDFNDDLLVLANTKLYFEDGSSWTEILGPDSASAFSTGDANSSYSKAEWNNHLLLTNDEYSPAIKVYKDDLGALQLRSAGLPRLATNPSLNGTAGANDYLYAFLYFYEYKVGTVTFQDFGPVREVQITGVDAPDSNQIDISSIPILTNTGGKHWDTANIKVKIYRSIAGGTTLYEVGQVNNGITIFTDTLDDSTLSTNAVIYTEGGVLENGEPPLAKAMHVNNGAAWYGNVKIGTEIVANRVYQSVLSDIDSVPETNFVNLEDDIVAISSYLDRTIVLCRRSVYRLDGVFDEQGNGGVTYQKISDTIGCISLSSVVQVQDGVVFASEEGFAFTDGFKTFKISDGFNKRYRDFVKTDLQRKRIYGVYDRIDGRVWWSVQSGDGVSDDVDNSYILDTRYGFRADSSFTTAGNQDEWAPTATLFKDGDLIRADRRGYIFKHNDELFSHPKTDLTKTVDQWFETPIMYNYVSAATSFGNPKNRKFVPRVLLNCENISNLSAQIVSLSDIGTREREVPIIRWRGNFIWGDPLFIWGDDAFTWGTPGFVEQMRRFHSDDLRCTYKQIQVKNAFVVITESDGFDTATVDATAKTATLDNPGTNDWPTEMGGYSLHFSNNYDLGYEILGEGLDTLTVKDDAGTLVDGSQSWEIRGFAKDEVIKLLGITILYAPLGQQQVDYDPSSLGGNSGT